MFGLGDLVIIGSIIFVASNKERVPELWKSLTECKKAFRDGLDGPTPREVKEYREKLPASAENDPHRDP